VDESPLSFRCLTETDRTLVRVRAIGELDLATCPEIEAALVDVRAGGADHVVLDLHEAGFLDSTALRMIMVWVRRSQADGFRFEVGRPSPAAMRAFELTSLLETLPFEGQNGG
jgi:anti-anti-sigma factor